MNNVLIGIDIGQLIALDEMAYKYKLSRTAVIRNLIYTGLWNEYHGQPGVFRLAPKVTSAGQHVQGGRLISVDGHGLNNESHELERACNAPVGEPIAGVQPTTYQRPRRETREKVTAAQNPAYSRPLNPQGSRDANGHRFMCAFLWSHGDSPCNCADDVAPNINQT